MNDLNPAGVDAAHEWWLWHGLTCCKNCGIVRRADGGNDTKPCKGVVPVGPRQLQSETGWLIELRGQRPSWWALIPDGEDGHSWTTDSLQALRFARRVDAEAYIEETGWTEAFASEHQWSDPPPSASLPQPEGETAALVERLGYHHEHPVSGKMVLINPDGPKAADAITSLSQRLAVAEARLAVVEAERDEARRDNERDRTIIIEARNAIHDAVVRRSWLLSGGRGSYEWDDQRFRDEFAAAMEEIGKPLAILDRLGVNWANCPTAPEEIKAARIDWKARADAAEAQLAHASEAAIEECAKVADEHAETWGAAMASPAIVIAAAIRAMKGGGE